MAFDYKLDVLRRCYETDLVPLQEETARLNDALQQLEQQMQAVEQEINHVGQHVSRNLRQPELRRMGMAYIREQQAVHANMASERSEAETRSKAVQEEMTAVRTRIRQLEKHRDRLEQEYAKQMQKQQFNESDDMWLRFKRAKELIHGN